MSGIPRIVSLLPSATEILFALGLGDDVVGVTHECDYPPEALTKPKLTRTLLPEQARSAGEIDRHVREQLHQGSSLYALDRELLDRLAPDLIVTQELCPVCAVDYVEVTSAAGRLKSDPRIISLEPSSLEEVYGTMQTVAEICGVPERGDSLVAELRLRAGRLRKRLAIRTFHRRPKTLVLEWTDPPMSGGHWAPDIVALAGGEAVLANAGGNSQRIEWHAVAAADPDVVIVAPCGFELPRARQALAELPPAFFSLRAARDGHVHAMDGSAYLNRPGPRLLDTAEIMADLLHGNVNA